MDKKLYVMPKIEVIEADVMQLLSGSGVSSESEMFDVLFGGVDTDGTVAPQ